MGQKFTYEGYHDQLKKDAKLVTGAVEVIRKTVKLHGPRAVQEEISALARAPVDRGTYRRSFHFDDIPLGATAYNFAPYAVVIEDGRRPGQRMPPIDVIFEWVKRKGIGRDFIGPAQRQVGPIQRGARRRSDRQVEVSRQQWGIALAIARKIKARGLPAHHILRLAAVEIDRAVREAIDDFLAGRGA